MIRRALVPAVPIVLALSLSACGEDGGGAGEAGDRVQVAAGFYALEYLTERVGGDHVEVATLTAPGQDPHDSELTVAQTAEVAEADVVVHLGGFQPVVDDAVQEVAEGAVVDVAGSADLVVTGSEHEHGEDDAHADEKAHADEDPHADEETHGEQGAHAEEETHADEETHAGEGDEDPHFWLDPDRMSSVGAQVADALSEADPDHAEDYRANLRGLEDDLAALDADFEEGLADCERDVVVVSHDAFGYLGESYGLDFHSIAGLSPDAEPSLQHLTELQDIIRSEGVTTVFSETLASPEMAETLSSDLGLETAVLDPVEGLSDETAEEDYVSLMRANLAALREANGCR